jgi:hypothetical protein
MMWFNVFVLVLWGYMVLGYLWSCGGGVRFFEERVWLVGDGKVFCWVLWLGGFGDIMGRGVGLIG